MKEGFPSLICATCIERLRIAYDFRNVCLQSDQTLQKYGPVNLDDSVKHSRLLSTPTKFEFVTCANGQSSEIVSMNGETQNSEYLHLKQFLDSEVDLPKSEHIVGDSPSASPDTSIADSFLNENGLDPIRTKAQMEQTIETLQVNQFFRFLVYD